ncbi:Hypothetical protein HVR_LOCUS95 [uncultured virus]|nr:Hypothetical protein HVR_LOCUS95 [uncultured virus]
MTEIVSYSKIMAHDVEVEIIRGLEINFGIEREQVDSAGYHVTALKLIGIIFNTINPTVDSELNIEWFQAYVQTPYEKRPTVKTLEQWVDEKFLPPLSIEINAAIEKEQDDIITNLAFGLKQRQQWIYQGIFNYIEKSTKNIETPTPWDIINVLTNEKGESLIRLVQFSSKISVKFVVNNTPIPDVYDVDLDQFMGMTLALFFLRLRATAEIFEIITPAYMFNVRLSQYYETQHKKIPGLYALETTGGRFTYKFDNMNFISGFITPFTWVGVDHHKYWTKFTQFADRNDKTGTDLTF